MQRSGLFPSARCERAPEPRPHLYFFPESAPPIKRYLHSSDAPKQRAVEKLSGDFRALRGSRIRRCENFRRHNPLNVLIALAEKLGATWAQNSALLGPKPEIGRASCRERGET